MPAMTLAEFIKRSRDELVTGVAQDIFTTDPMYDYIPWIGYQGSGITWNRETTMGDSQFAGVGTAITAKAASVVTPVLYRGTKVIGDAEIDKQQIAESGGDTGTLIVDEVSSKAKSVGRQIKAGIATGTGVAPIMNSMHTLCDASQYTASGGVGGAVLTFDRMDELADLVKAKDGFVDFYVANGREIRKIRSLYRALGGVPMIEVKLGNRTFQVVEFNGVPVFQNDYLSTTETDDGAALVGGAQSSIYAGAWDDGSKKVGCALIYPEGDNMGISIEQVGAKEAYDEEIYRVKSYVNFGLFNRRGLARMTGVKV